MGIAVIFVELWYVLPTNGDLVGINFANVSKPVQLDNRRDMQGWIETLYARGSRDVILSVYHKIDLAILWFIITTECCWRLILTCFKCKQAFQYLNHANYCDNCIYARISPKAISEFRAQKIILWISMRYYKLTEWEEICVEEKYSRHVEHTIVKTIKTTNAQ